MDFLFKHFGKLWLVVFIASLLLSIGSLALVAWAIIKLTNHFTATAFVSQVLTYTC